MHIIVKYVFVLRVTRPLWSGARLARYRSFQVACEIQMINPHTWLLLHVSYSSVSVCLHSFLTHQKTSRYSRTLDKATGIHSARVKIPSQFWHDHVFKSRVRIDHLHFASNLKTSVKRVWPGSFGKNVIQMIQRGFNAVWNYIAQYNPVIIC